MIKPVHYILIVLGCVPGVAAAIGQFYPSTGIVCGCIAAVSGIVAAQLALASPAISSTTNAKAVADASWNTKAKPVQPDYAELLKIIVSTLSQFSPSAAPPPPPPPAS